jgi:hypothetical protein
MLNQNEIYTNWPMVQDIILKHWTRLSPSELEQTDGKLTDIIRLVQKNYGSSEDFEEDFEDICWYCETRIKTPRNTSGEEIPQ